MYGKCNRMSAEVYAEDQVKVSTDFKTTLPKSARQRLGADIGDKITFQVRADGEVVVKKVDGE